MNHRLAIIRPITPRLPLTLVTVRLPSITAWARKNFGYTPLSLIFRRARGAKSRSMPPITYVSRGGETVVIAPRINLTIQWAERLRSLLDPGQPSVQRSQRVGWGPLSTPHPITERNRLTLTTTTDQQERKEKGRAFSMPPVVLRRYPSTIGALVQWKLKRIRGKKSLSSIPGTEGLRLMSVDHAQHQKQMPQTVSMRSVISKSDLIPIRAPIQQDPGTSQAASSVSTFAAKSYLTLFDATDRQTQAVKSIPVLMPRRDLKMAARKNSAPGPVESTFLNTRADDDVQFAAYRKRTEVPMPSLRQREYDTAMTPASYVHLPGQPLPVSVGFKSKFLGRFCVPEVQRRDLKMATRKHSAPGPIESTFLNTQADDDVQFAGYRKRTEVTMPSLRQRQYDTAMTPASYVHLPGQPLPVNVRFKSKFLGRIRVPEIQSKVHRQDRIADFRYLTKTGRWMLAHSETLYGQPVSGTFDQVGSRVDSPADMHVAFHGSPAADHGYASWRTESSHHDLNKKQPAGRQQPGASHERRISPAEVLYRTEKTPPPPPSVTVPPAPAPVPAQPPRIDIDRLSRDVWRQLEKRIRIERERHGRL